MRLSAGTIVAAFAGALAACGSASEPPEVVTKATWDSETDESGAQLTWSEAGVERYKLFVQVLARAITGPECVPGAYVGFNGGGEGPAGEPLLIQLSAHLPEMPRPALQWDLGEVPAEPKVVTVPENAVPTYLSERDDTLDVPWRSWYGGTVTVVDWSATHATLEIAGAGLTACDTDACLPYGPITLTLESLPRQEIPTDEVPCHGDGVADPATGLCLSGDANVECATLPW
jgi:hypothetical protein